MNRDIIVVGASAGGLDVLRALVAQLPAEFPASVLMVWHMPAESPGLLPDILDRAGPLPATQARDYEVIEPGHIYVATPDHHLVVESGRMRVTHGPKENRFRPSVDVLFRSAALAYGRRVIGIILSGILDDGASGLFAVKQEGGIAIVQDPTEATYYDMPINAMRATEVDHVVPVGGMGVLLTRLLAQPLDPDLDFEAEGELPVSDLLKTEVRIAREDHALEIGVESLGEPSIFTCPECHGTLLQIKEGNRLRFRCHTGHAFSLNTLLVEVTKSIEDALWNGVRAIEESELLLSHMANHLRDSGQTEAAALFWEKAQNAKQRAELVRQAAMNNEVLTPRKVNPATPSEAPEPQ